MRAIRSPIRARCWGRRIVSSWYFTNPPIERLRNLRMSNMPRYFMIFLATLAASLLLYLGAIATVAITRRPLPVFFRGMAASRLQAAGVALLWSSVGVAWLLFFNV